LPENGLFGPTKKPFRQLSSMDISGYGRNPPGHYPDCEANIKQAKKKCQAKFLEPDLIPAPDPTYQRRGITMNAIQLCYWATRFKQRF